MAQSTPKKIAYQVHWSNGFENKKIIKNSTVSKLTRSEFNESKERLFGKLSAAGYIAAKLTKVDSSSTPWNLHIDVGEKFQWKKLNVGNLDEGILSNIGFRDKLYLNRPLSSSDVLNLFNSVLDYCENNGYPFAAIQFDSVKINNQQIEASLNLIKNSKITIDTVIIVGSSNMSNHYLSSYLNIKPKDLYSEKLIRAIPTRIKELAFVQEYQAALVEFNQESTKLYVYLKNKKANDFNGIIGFMPNEENGDLLITGDITLKLQNAIGKGETIDLSWKKLQTQTQDLKARIQYPFLFKTPLGTDAALHIYRRDTSFTTLSTNLGVQYIFRGLNHFGVFWGQEQSNLISTKDFDLLTELPQYADIRINSFGFNCKIEKLNYLLNPTKGYKIEVSVEFGNKEIRQNPAINPLVYENLKLKTNRAKGQLELRYFVPLATRHTLLLKNLSGTIVNDNLFSNELYRIGGLKTLRGFDEESIFASSYSIFTLEYRFILEENSFFSLFFDQGWYENQGSEKLITDLPYGVGTGINFDTKIGIFSISYALGKQFDNTLQFRTAKIHFGFVNFF